MGHRLRPGPIGIVLVPDHYSSMMRRFVKNLVMPEPNSAAQQLRGRHSERRMPKNIVQTWENPPRTERMKENLLRIGRLVQGVLIQQFVSRMRRINERHHF